MCYSTDMLKKFTFEREIEHLKQEPPNPSNITIIQYMAKELEDIEKRYEETPTE